MGEVTQAIVALIGGGLVAAFGRWGVKIFQASMAEQARMNADKNTTIASLETRVRELEAELRTKGPRP